MNPEQEIVMEEEVPQQASPKAVDLQELAEQEELVEEEIPESAIKSILLDQLVKHKLLGGEIRNPEKFKKLVEDIKQHGLNQPILVRPIGKNKYEIVAGYNRCKAVKEIGESNSIEAIVKSMSDQESAERCLCDNILTQELPPYLYEQCVYELYKTGNYNSQKELAGKLSLSDNWIGKNLKACKIRAEILQERAEMLFKDLTTETICQANKIRDHGVDLRGLIQFLKKIEKQNIKPKRVEEIVKNYSKWSPEKQYNYLYSEADSAETKKQTKNVKLYYNVNKNQHELIDSLDDEQESLRHTKLTIVLLCEALLKKKYITAIHFRQIADDILNCRINPHDYDGTSELEISLTSHAEKLEKQANDVTSEG